MKPKLYVGTVGMSVWSTDDLGATWFRPNSEFGMTNEARIWALAGHDDDPETLLAGTDDGLYRWSEKTRTWRTVNDDLAGTRIWAVARSPADPAFIVIGLSPGRLMRSFDNGRNWETLPARIKKRCMFDVISRVTQIKFDPIDPDTIWATVEIDAVWRSTDRGDNWRRFDSGLLSDDAHGIEIVAPRGHRRILLATNKGLHISDDDAASFRHVALDTPRDYLRALVASPAMDGTVFLSNGDGPPGSWGKLFRSGDWGQSWEEIVLDPAPNSTIWTIAVNAFDPDLVFCCSNLGHLYKSEDRGRSFTRLARELGEVRSSMWRAVATGADPG